MFKLGIYLSAQEWLSELAEAATNEGMYRRLAAEYVAYELMSSLLK